MMAVPLRRFAMGRQSTAALLLLVLLLLPPRSSSGSAAAQPDLPHDAERPTPGRAAKGHGPARPAVTLATKAYRRLKQTGTSQPLVKAPATPPGTVVADLVAPIPGPGSYTDVGIAAFITVAVGSLGLNHSLEMAVVDSGNDCLIYPSIAPFDAHEVVPGTWELPQATKDQGYRLASSAPQRLWGVTDPCPCLIIHGPVQLGNPSGRHFNVSLTFAAAIGNKIGNSFGANLGIGPGKEPRGVATSCNSTGCTLWLDSPMVAAGYEFSLIDINPNMTNRSALGGVVKPSTLSLTNNASITDGFARLETRGKMIVSMVDLTLYNASSAVAGGSTNQSADLRPYFNDTALAHPFGFGGTNAYSFSACMDTGGGPLILRDAPDATGKTLFPGPSNAPRPGWLPPRYPARTVDFGFRYRLTDYHRQTVFCVDAPPIWGAGQMSVLTSPNISILGDGRDGGNVGGISFLFVDMVVQKSKAGGTVWLWLKRKHPSSVCP